MFDWLLCRALERLQRADAPSSSASSEDPAGSDDLLETPQELSYRRAIEQEKAVYKDAIESIKTLKPEIEHVKKLLARTTHMLKTQHDAWFEALHVRSEYRDLHLLGDAEEEAGNSNNSNSVSSSVTASISSSRLPFAADSKDSYLGGAGGGGGGGGGAQVRGSSAAASSARDPRTGDSKHDVRATGAAMEGEVGEDIAAFYEAKEALLRQRGAR